MDNRSPPAKFLKLWPTLLMHDQLPHAQPPNRLLAEGIEHRVQPAPGTILMWPAFLHHLVHSNLSQTPRISISFNIVLKQSSAHLPRQ